jgi:hypothetical protein
MTFFFLIVCCSCARYDLSSRSNSRCSPHFLSYTLNVFYYHSSAMYFFFPSFTTLFFYSPFIRIVKKWTLHVKLKVWLSWFQEYTKKYIYIYIIINQALYAEFGLIICMFTPYLDVSLELASIVLCMFSRYLRRLSIDIKFKVFLS